MKPILSQSVLKRLMVQKASRDKGKPASKFYTRANFEADKLAEKMAPEIEAGLKMFKRRIQNTELEEQLKDLTVDQVIDELPWELMQGDLDKLPNRVFEGLIAGGTLALAFTPIRFQRDTRFKVGTSNISKIVDRRTGDLIQGIEDSSRATVRQIVQRSVAEGRSISVTAKLIGDTVGLDDRRALAVKNFRVMIEEQNFAAMTQQQRAILAPRIARTGVNLRDPKKRAQFVRAANRKQIDSVVNAYSARLLQQRAMTIARTESLTAVNEGIREMWDQMADDGFLDRQTTGKRWIIDPTTACTLCRPMSGVIVRLDEMFQTQIGPVQGPPLHVNCNCMTDLVLQEEQVEEEAA